MVFLNIFYEGLTFQYYPKQLIDNLFNLVFKKIKISILIYVGTIMKSVQKQIQIKVYKLKIKENWCFFNYKHINYKYILTKLTVLTLFENTGSHEFTRAS